MQIRLPSDDELSDFLDDAIPIAEKKAKKYGLELEAWMVVEALYIVCPELEKCNQNKLLLMVEQSLGRESDRS